MSIAQYTQYARGKNSLESINIVQLTLGTVDVKQVFYFVQSLQERSLSFNKTHWSRKTKETFQYFAARRIHLAFKRTYSPKPFLTLRHTHKLISVNKIEILKQNLT